jgi:predicted polyphosphate/ATP-dependent NAD kinase
VPVDGHTLSAVSTECGGHTLQEDVAARVRAVFPVLGSPAGLAAEATVCAQLLQTVARGDNLILADPLRDWSEELRRRQAA